ncbi:response regulator [Aromatoleum toluclasticum]|uniref:response regulator transcription factor n=1 Tax=Aromatoleum toluclasticum TaxID=92003 RepID=UPI001D19050A|nr:response regulator [Aromatoleum toluclasticum]MCC4114224.1 response regulator [Aromatoleum toluclasticum]
MNGEQSVFIVDDDESFRNAARRVFRSAGFCVETFESATAFLSGYRPCDEACLILDLRMPGVGGLELLERLRQRQIDLPVIIYTGNADVPVTVRAMQAGAFSVVEKPFSDELLIARVREAIASSRTQRARNATIAEARAKLAGLTEREREIAQCLADGLSAPQIGARLGISARTVEAHRANLFRKLEISASAALAQLVLWAALGDE